VKLPLGWLNDYVQITVPPATLAKKLTLAGVEVTAVLRQGGETVLETEITPNRPDLLSLIGVAREIAALTGRKLRLPRTAAVAVRRTHRPHALTIRLEDKQGCPRYIGTLIDGVAVAPSPPWLAKRLEAAGIRPVNNIVDITNYVLCEHGQPLHAFDAAKLADHTILVRRARSGERLVTIDGVARPLPPHLLVIADKKHPVAAAGIMGGQATEVGPATTSILLESAWFDPAVVRRGSRALGLASASSYRFERGVDPVGVETAAARAAELIRKLAGGRVAEYLDAGAQPKAAATVILHPQRVAAVLGVPLSAAAIGQYLKRLRLPVVRQGRRWQVKIPSYRRDLRLEEDLIEEVARLHGYERIPATLPPLAAVPPGTVATSRRAAELARDACTACGCDEAVTYGLVSRRLIEGLGRRAAEAIRVRNPVSQEQEFLRPTLLPGLLQSAAVNLHHQRPGVALFELGHMFVRGTEGQVLEQQSLGWVAAGLRPGSWQQPSLPYDLWFVKGAVAAVARRCGAASPSLVPQAFPWLAAGTAGSWFVEGGACGWLGQVAPAMAEAFDIKIPVYAAEISFDRLIAKANFVKKFQPLARTPFVRRDLSLLVEQTAIYDELVTTIRAAGGALLVEVLLFDRYTGSQVPAGMQSLAFALIYRHPTRTLTDAEVAAAHQTVVQALTSRFHATIR